MHRQILYSSLALGLFGGGVAVGTARQEAAAPVAAPARVYELRTYTSPPGKLGALHSRFRNHTMGIFERHGMKNVGYWVPQDSARAGNTLIYIVSHASRDAARRSWEAFGRDPEWQRVRTASEANGPIVSKVESVFLSPVDYSPMR